MLWYNNLEEEDMAGSQERSFQEQTKRKEGYGAAAGATMFWGPWIDHRPEAIGDLEEYAYCQVIGLENHGGVLSFYVQTVSNEKPERFWLVRSRKNNTWVGNYAQRK